VAGTEPRDRGERQYTEPLGRDKRKRDRLPFAGNFLANGRCCCRMSLVGEAEAGSAGEHPAKE
jgi:hypothetical protein